MQKENETEPMNACQVFCPNLACSKSGQLNQGNVKIHCYKRQRYRCNTYRQCFTERTGSVFEGLRRPHLAGNGVTWGCPIQAIVPAFGLDERTVLAWQLRAGKHCEQVHQTLLCKVA